jgi:hypothetical protein
MAEDDEIFADGEQPATLQYGEHLVPGLTLREAVLAWRNLPSEDRASATISVTVKGGPAYAAGQIERLNFGPQRRSSAG